jgi:hypothetical protein
MPSWFLLAEEDRMINPKTQRFMADRMKATVRSDVATALELGVDCLYSFDERQRKLAWAVRLKLN